MPTGTSSYSVKQHCSNLNRSTLSGEVKAFSLKCIWFSPHASVITGVLPCAWGSFASSPPLLITTPYLRCVCGLVLLPMWAPVKAQQDWHCCSLPAYIKSPGLSWLLELSPGCYVIYCWQPGWKRSHILVWVCLPRAWHFESAGVTLSCVSLQQ